MWFENVLSADINPKLCNRRRYVCKFTLVVFHGDMPRGVIDRIPTRFRCTYVYIIHGMPDLPTLFASTLSFCEPFDN